MISESKSLVFESARGLLFVFLFRILILMHSSLPFSFSFSFSFSLLILLLLLILILILALILISHSHCCFYLFRVFQLSIVAQIVVFVCILAQVLCPLLAENLRLSLAYPRHVRLGRTTER